MRFIELYENALEVRDMDIKGTQTYTNEVLVLEKLMNIAFENNDELPSKFYIFKIALTKNELVDLLIRIGIKADIKVINESIDTGNIYEITLKS